MDYSIWKAYKKAGYNVPNRFLKYLYQRHNLPYVRYKRHNLPYVRYKRHNLPYVRYKRP